MNLTGATNQPRANTTQKLEDKELLLLLAEAAADCYDLHQGDVVCGGKMRITYRHFQDGDHPANRIQFGIYEVLSGTHRGKKIMAIRGTQVLGDGHSAAMTTVQDVSIAVGGPSIRLAIDAAIKGATEHQPDYVCGHSLASFLAECVCSATGIPGAAFNGPGPVSPIPTNNLLPGHKHDGVKFEVHLTSNDLVSLVAFWTEPGQAHIGSPIWHQGKADLVETHLMGHLIEEFSG